MQITSPHRVALVVLSLAGMLAAAALALGGRSVFTSRGAQAEEDEIVRDVREFWDAARRDDLRADDVLARKYLTPLTREFLRKCYDESRPAGEPTPEDSGGVKRPGGVPVVSAVGPSLNTIDQEWMLVRGWAAAIHRDHAEPRAIKVRRHARGEAVVYIRYKDDEAEYDARIILLLKEDDRWKIFATDDAFVNQDCPNFAKGEN